MLKVGKYSYKCASKFYLGYFISKIFLDGNWTEWSEFDNCTLSCGGGTHTRTRTCDNPKPDYGGTNCSDTNVDFEIQLCNTQPCPPIGIFV
jgi:hypothetical protein